MNSEMTAPKNHTFLLAQHNMPHVLARTERLILLNHTERKASSLELGGSVPPPTCHCGEQNKSYPAKGHQSPSQKPAPDCRRSKPDQPHGVASSVQY